MSEEKRKRPWVDGIDTDKISIYPIQFANCDRLRENSAVYIFDEVGSGKTISSGLMALDYLNCISKKNTEQDTKKIEVLVITTNALVKKGYNSEEGQFLKDWYDKLPFKEGDREKIKVINNYYGNIKKIKECELTIGLLIVDEAHLFLNKDSLRYKALEDIKAQKVVFLTATPIKTSKEDLNIYWELARKILDNDDLFNPWKEENFIGEQKAENLICSVFDPKFPVTRYFKDTTMFIAQEGEYQKNQARRLIPQIWEYEGGRSLKNKVLFEKINECYELSDKNKFIVFTRYVEDEAEEIGCFLNAHGYCEYSGSNATKCKNYKVITGKNSYELSKYSGTENLPMVLILTYQIAEQGVNLPGYNYVINYHVSAFPSALEQRFGRIDRMGKNGSAFKEINMCFLISKDQGDADVCNFCRAVSIYLQNLIPYLPSRNVILSTEMINKYIEKKELVEEYVADITKLIYDTKQLNNITEIRLGEKIEGKCDPKLLRFIDEHGIEFDTNTDRECVIKKFQKDVKDILSCEYNNIFNVNNELSLDKAKKIIEEVGDKVFYVKDDLSMDRLEKIDAIDCGRFISVSEEFQKYKKTFEEEVKILRLEIKYREELKKVSGYFEKAFLNNDFNCIFSHDGYSEIMKAELSSIGVADKDKEALGKHCQAVIPKLSFFKMCEIYKKIIQKLVRTSNGDIVKRFDFNPFITAFNQLYVEIRDNINPDIQLTEEFLEAFENLHKKEFIDKDKEVVYEIAMNEKNVLQASNWYKLAYYYTRKEEICIIGNKPFNESLFHYYFFTKDGRRRAQAFGKYLDAEELKHLDDADIWTQGIIRELM